jgi:hypothetical protein
MDPMYATMLQLSLGFIMLTTGRQLYWLFTGGTASVSVFVLGPLLFNLPQNNELFLLALAIGVIVAVLASNLGRIMVAIVLFLAGSYLLFILPEIMGFGNEWVSWFILATAGIAAVGMVLTWFDFSLTLLSSLTGASLIIQAVNLSGVNAIIAYFGMAIFGMITQLILMQYWPVSEEV